MQRTHDQGWESWWILNMLKDTSWSTNFSHKQIQMSFSIQSFLEVKLYLPTKVYTWHIQELVVFPASASFNMFLCIAIQAQLWLFPLDVQWVIRLDEGGGAAMGLIINLCHMHAQSYTHRPKEANNKSMWQHGVKLQIYELILYELENILQIWSTHIMKPPISGRFMFHVRAHWQTLINYLINSMEQSPSGTLAVSSASQEISHV
jgi:hypothetical protein